MEVGAIQAYLERWRAVAAREAAERRDTPVAVRWRQLNSIIALAEGLGLDWREQNPEEVARIRSLLEPHPTGEKDGG
jgi:hypothetical protein